MRKFVLVLAIALPGAALADRDGAVQLLVNNLLALGGDAGQSETIARCFVDRMTDAQAAGFVAATTSAEREAVVNGIADKDGASSCVQTAMGG